MLAKIGGRGGGLFLVQWTQNLYLYTRISGKSKKSILQVLKII